LTIEQFGWNTTWHQEFLPWEEKGFIPGRVTIEHKRMYRVQTNDGEYLCELSGKFRYMTSERHEFPAVGDWVIVQALPKEKKGFIQGILPRRSQFIRKVAGEEATGQVIAANIDTIFLVMALTNDFNVRRLERYLVLAWESGANPVIILTKADLCSNVETYVEKVHSVALGVPVHPISCYEGTGLDELSAYLQVGKTIALVGSSGVGKSTLMNYWLKEEYQAVQEVRQSDNKGRHTTTHRVLFHLPEGACVIDTPGMRELSLWESNEGLDETFEDIIQLAQYCHFNDCQHNTEPKCAVRNAIENGSLSPHRLESYRKLQKELAYVARKENERLQHNSKRRWKAISKEMRQYKKRN
jgi:ribosome biogenesis GTPase / thiamine phosphate phosphatase